MVQSLASADGFEMNLVVRAEGGWTLQDVTKANNNIAKILSQPFAFAALELSGDPGRHPQSAVGRRRHTGVQHRCVLYRY